MLTKKQIVGIISILGVIAFVIYYLISPSSETVRHTAALCAEMQTIHVNHVKTSNDAKALEVQLKNIIAKHPNADIQLSLIINEFRNVIIDMAQLIENSEKYNYNSWWNAGQTVVTGIGSGIAIGAASGPGALITAISGGIWSIKNMFDKDSQARAALKTQLSKFEVNVDAFSRKSKDVFQHIKDKYAVDCRF